MLTFEVIIGIVVVCLGVAAASRWFYKNVSNSESFSHIASGVQNYTLSFAIIIGGVWTLYVFNAKFQVENAKAMYEKRIRDLEQQASLEILVKANQFSSPKEQGYYLAVDVTIKNNGNRTEILEIKEGPIIVCKVNVDKKGELVFGPEKRLKFYTFPKVVSTTKTVLSNNIEHMSFFTQVDEPGLYSVIFNAKRSKEAATKAVKAGVDSTAANYWVGSTFLTVLPYHKK